MSLFWAVELQSHLLTTSVVVKTAETETKSCPTKTMWGQNQEPVQYIVMD